MNDESADEFIFSIREKKLDIVIYESHICSQIKTQC